ncbi:MAG: hypothetical protein KGI54_13880 [Pseudomonadota bacterium]|nr:hypothetical protein [Pseudomonadota bacterium]
MDGEDQSGHMAGMIDWSQNTVTYIGGKCMHIQHIEVSNFRKLKDVRIDFSETNTVFAALLGLEPGRTVSQEVLIRCT